MICTQFDDNQLPSFGRFHEFLNPSLQLQWQVADPTPGVFREAERRRPSPIFQTVLIVPSEQARRPRINMKPPQRIFLHVISLVDFERAQRDLASVFRFDRTSRLWALTVSCQSSHPRNSPYSLAFSALTSQFSESVPLSYTGYAVDSTIHNILSPSPDDGGPRVGCRHHNLLCQPVEQQST